MLRHDNVVESSDRPRPAASPRTEIKIAQLTISVISLGQKHVIRLVRERESLTCEGGRWLATNPRYMLW